MAARWDSITATNNNQFGSIYTSVIDLIQNITRRADRKPDGCDAGGTGVHAIFCEGLVKLRVGMDVAHLQVAFGSWVQGFGTVSRRRFRHAVDKSGDSVGFVADWLARGCRWQSRSPAARGSCGCFGY